VSLQSILDEVERLNSVSSRLEGLADQHPHATEEILSIAGNVRNIATILAVLAAAKLHGEDGFS
jgi:nitrogen-specific signal transduction histidine kinase